MSTEPEHDALTEERFRHYREQRDRPLPNADQTLDQIENSASQDGRRLLRPSIQ